MKPRIRVESTALIIYGKDSEFKAQLVWGFGLWIGIWFTRVGMFATVVDLPFLSLSYCIYWEGKLKPECERGNR